MNNEKLIFEIIAKSKSRTQGDLSKILLEQGFFNSSPLPRGLKERDELVTGNPVDIKKEFEKQNPETENL